MVYPKGSQANRYLCSKFLETAASCQWESGSKDVIVTKVIPLFFKAEIQHTTISSLIACTRYFVTIKSTEGSQLNNCYHAMSWKYMTASCQAILWLTCKHLWLLWFLFAFSYSWMTLLTLNYLTLNKSYESLIVMGIYKHFVIRFLANLMQDRHIYSSEMMKNV